MNKPLYGRMRTAPESGGTLLRGLTRSLDLGKEGLMPETTRVCSVEDCGRVTRARGLCNPHYMRLLRNGTTDDRRPTLDERFWGKVDATGSCWEWIAYVNRYGYGEFHLEGRAALAHRVAYQLLVGSIPEGLQLDHLCRNTKCVNPDHLEPVTGRINTLRGTSPSARHAVKTHCPKGHPYSQDNLHVTKSGQRKCRACNRERVARYKALKRGRTE